MVNNPSSGRQLKTLKTAFELVDIIQQQNGMSIESLAKEMDLAQSTVHGYVKTLTNTGYLVYEDGKYHIGLEFLNKGGYARTRKPEYDLIISKLEGLAEQTGERVQFIVEENGRGYYLHTSIGQNAVQVDAHIGKVVHLHASSAGKAILAHLSEDRVKQILNQWGTPAYTQHTITSDEGLLEELSTIRERGYSISDQESISGLRAIGAPIRSQSSGQPLGAISLSGPAHRLKGEWFEQEIPDIVLAVVNEIELDLEYQ
ncbi:IclR family transcriptional regulator [Natrialba taiwanensis]|uniref:ArcR family transcription regulator n=1 Tax=Natrialba taiwanensis DSM 12281 TaxID=1230458 RepID=M0ACH4_9EURY|nr:IclR family transcriptional regulator [Natrialba taiwanensis]ELY96244.1 ArcR family transcription regulator [Natrialba taiwanensis DSM 12281]